MAYNIKRYDGLTAVATVKDGDIDNATLSINLIGKNRSGYGEAQNQNFVYLLENFAGTTPPSNALSGQIWYDSTNKRLKYHDAISQTSYRSIARLETSETQPSVSSVGDLWFGSTSKQLKAWDGTEYVLIGPSTTDPSTTMELLTVEDSSGSFHNVLAAKVLNQYIYIISSDPFVVAGRDPIASQGFTIIYEGITLRNVNSTGRSVSDYKYWGTASDADNLGGISAEKHVKFNDSGVAVLNNEGFTIGSDELKASFTSGVSKIIGKTEFYFNANNTDVIKITSGAILRGSSDVTIGSNQTPFSNIYADSANFTGNSYIRIPVGTTANRPVSPIVMNGQIRYNSDTNVYEGYSQGSWVTFSGGGGTGNYHPLNGGGPGSTYYLNASYISLTNNATTDSAPDGSIRYNGGQLQGKLSGSWVNLTGGGGTITTPVSISNGGTGTASPDLTFKLTQNTSIVSLEQIPYSLKIQGTDLSAETGLILSNTFTQSGITKTINGFIGAGQQAMTIASNSVAVNVGYPTSISESAFDGVFRVCGYNRDSNQLKNYFDVMDDGIHGYYSNSTNFVGILDIPTVNGLMLTGTGTASGNLYGSTGIIFKNNRDGITPTYSFIGAGNTALTVASQKVSIAAGDEFGSFIGRTKRFSFTSDGLTANYSETSYFDTVLVKNEVHGLLLHGIPYTNGVEDRSAGYGIIVKNDLSGVMGFFGAMGGATTIASQYVTMSVGGDLDNDGTIDGMFKVFVGYQDSGSFWVNANGVYGKNAIIQSFSDVRLKDITGNILNPLDKINSLNGFYYKFNDLAKSYGFNNNNNTQYAGLSAQDVQQVFPEVVTTAPFDLDDTSKSKSGENYLTIQYERLIPLLVEGIKEQTKIIESLVSRIEQLEAIIKQ